MSYQQAETKPSDTRSACFEEKLGILSGRSNTSSGPKASICSWCLLYKDSGVSQGTGTWYFLQDLQRQTVLSCLKFAWKGFLKTCLQKKKKKKVQVTQTIDSHHDSGTEQTFTTSPLPKKTFRNLIRKSKYLNRTGNDIPKCTKYKEWRV